MPIKLNGATSGSVELDVPAAVSGGDITFTLPNGVGSAEQVLKNSGSAGALEFGSAGLTSMQVFTSSGTWTKPSGITRIKVYVTAGGGGGGAANSDDTANGGGAGGTSIKVIDVTSISSETVTVGAGGVGAPANYNANSYGGTSSFGSHCSATGGNRYGGGWSLAGEGGTATGGDLNITGGDGVGGNIDVVENYHTGGTGGGSYWGQGGRGGASIYNNNSRGGRAYGSGGGGAADLEDSPDGAPGVVVVEEYS